VCSAHILVLRLDLQDLKQLLHPADMQVCCWAMFQKCQWQHGATAVQSTSKTLLLSVDTTQSVQPTVSNVWPQLTRSLLHLLWAL
jgi:hypothetical protein